jgi:hypothetical protein
MELSFGQITDERSEAAKSGQFRIALMGDFSGRAAKGEVEIGSGLLEQQLIKLDTGTLDKLIAQIVKPQVNRIKTRVKAAQSMPCEYSPAVVDQTVSRCQAVTSGGRVMTGVPVAEVTPNMVGNEFTYSFDEPDQLNEIR